jgi:hypothetical protein
MELRTWVARRLGAQAADHRQPAEPVPAFPREDSARDLTSDAASQYAEPMLTTLVIVAFCVIINLIYLYFVKQQIEESERSDS